MGDYNVVREDLESVSLVAFDDSLSFVWPDVRTKSYTFTDVNKKSGAKNRDLFRPLNNRTLGNIAKDRLTELHHYDSRWSCRFQSILRFLGSVTTKNVSVSKVTTLSERLAAETMSIRIHNEWLIDLLYRGRQVSETRSKCVSRRVWLGS